MWAHRRRRRILYSDRRFNLSSVASGRSIVNLKHNVEAIWAEEEEEEGGRMGTCTLPGKIIKPKWLREVQLNFFAPERA